jgi:hypothetical protein
VWKLDMLAVAPFRNLERDSVEHDARITARAMPALFIGDDPENARVLCGEREVAFARFRQLGLIVARPAAFLNPIFAPLVQPRVYLSV